MERTLSATSKNILLTLSREALIEAANRRPLIPVDLGPLSDEIRRVRTSFITLKEGEKLRGCIGSLEAKIALAEDVRQHTYSAAVHDYRFPPIKSHETENISIEISILSQPDRLEFAHPKELLDLLQMRKDGVIINYENHRATFLPQVWQRIPSPEQFLNLLCEKANLGSQAWETLDVQVFVYQVEKIEEER
jgi:AmmeMemoRadiSam system protein A